MSNKINLYFSTMTGNAEELAERLEKKLTEANFDVTNENLGDVSAESLTENAKAIFIVSTWGDGEPPDDAYDVFSELEDNEFDFSGMSHAVFGLGDSTYPEFNAFAINLDNRLQALGASSFAERIDADVDFDDVYEAWEIKILNALT